MNWIPLEVVSALVVFICTIAIVGAFVGVAVELVVQLIIYLATGDDR